MIVSTNNQFIPSFTFPLPLTLQDLFHVELSYTASNSTLTTTMQRNGQPFGPIKDVTLGSSFTDFRVDTFAVSSYSDAGADGSLLARGSIDNVVLVVPNPPLTSLKGVFANAMSVQFTSQTNWVYTLERSEDWVQWRDASASVPGTGGRVDLADQGASPAPPAAFYRVRATRP